MRFSLPIKGPRFFRRVLPLLVLLMAMAGSSSRAALSVYQFSSTTGSATDMSSATFVTSTNYSTWTSTDDAAAGPIDIGFTFNFDGTGYTQFSVSTNGLLGLGSTRVATSYSNSITGLSSTTPAIFALWDDMGLNAGQNGSVCYLVSGSSPNRVLTVQWNVYQLGNSSSAMLYQVRLYESSNKIEFWYGATNSASSYSASIGAFVSSTNFISITGGSTSSVSYTTANNSTTPPASGTVYSLTPCQSNITISGNVAQGGTAAMNNADSLLIGQRVQRGNTGSYTPFSIAVGASPCYPISYTYSLSGANAGDYRLTPATGVIGASTSLTPTLSFSPSGLGKRYATLTVTDDHGFSRFYYLAGEGSTRMSYTGTIAQGGTSTAANGDTLMQNILVIRKTSGSFTPITITNINGNTSTPTAPVTFQLIDPSGQYSISPTSASLGALQSVSPVITFRPTGVGFQEAFLKVTADGEATRTYMLRAYAAAPGGEFYANNNKLDATSSLYINQTSCVGEFANTMTLNVKNTGVGDFVVNGLSFFAIDTVYGQGNRYPLLRDGAGRLIRSNDYMVTASPAVAPLSMNQPLTFPMVIPQGQQRTLYLTYVGQRPGKRYARAFFVTNGQNFIGIDTTIAAPAVEGTLNFDLFGRAVGGVLSDNQVGGAPKTIVFPPLSIGDSSTMTFTLRNPGNCDLRISQKFMQIASGDVEDFTLMSGLVGAQTDNNGDYIIPSGGSATVSVRFIPTMAGSRRASLWLKTNDSTISLPGVAERGSYYLDLFGEGKATMITNKVSMGMAAIGADSTYNTVTFVNPSRSPITVMTVALGGADATDFAQWTNAPWPASSKVVPAGGKLTLGVIFAPRAGVDGPRNATLDVTLATGEVFSAKLDGMAGSRTLQLNPATIAFTPIAKGKEARQTITVTNTGSMPVMLTTAPALSGANAADFSLSAFPRLMLAPGQVEFLEVTYHPTVAGSSTAQVDFTSNAGPMQSIGLTATASSTKLDLDSKVRLEISSIGGQAAERILKLRNEGSEAVSISDVRFSGADAAQFRVVRGADRVEANAEGELVVEVIPAGHDLVAELALTATNEVTGEQLVRVAEIRAEEQRTSGVSGEDAVAGGLELRAAVPNPTHGAVELSYRMVKGTEIRLSLYDMNGTLVKVLDGGYRGQGEHVVRVDLSDLASGQYQYRLTAAGVTLTKSVTVVK